MVAGVGEAGADPAADPELTQDELATASGISRSFVSQIEHGAHGVDVVRLVRLAAALEVPLVELMGETPGD